MLDLLLGLPVDVHRARTVLANLGIRFVALAKIATWRDLAQVAYAPGIRLIYSRRVEETHPALVADLPGGRGDGEEAAAARSVTGAGNLASAERARA